MSTTGNRLHQCRDARHHAPADSMGSPEPAKALQSGEAKTGSDVSCSSGNVSHAGKTTGAEHEQNEDEIGRQSPRHHRHGGPQPARADGRARGQCLPTPARTTTPTLRRPWHSRLATRHQPPRRTARPSPSSLTSLTQVGQRGTRTLRVLLSCHPFSMNMTHNKGRCTLSQSTTRDPPTRQYQSPSTRNDAAHSPQLPRDQDSQCPRSIGPDHHSTTTSADEPVPLSPRPADPWLPLMCRPHLQIGGPESPAWNRL